MKAKDSSHQGATTRVAHALLIQSNYKYSRCAWKSQAKHDLCNQEQAKILQKTSGKLTLLVTWASKLNPATSLPLISNQGQPQSTTVHPYQRQAYSASHMGNQTEFCHQLCQHPEKWLIQLSWIVCCMREVSHHQPYDEDPNRDPDHDQPAGWPSPLGSMISLSGFVRLSSCAIDTPSGPESVQHRHPPASSLTTTPSPLASPVESATRSHSSDVGLADFKSLDGLHWTNLLSGLHKSF